MSRPSRRRALLIGIGAYDDETFAALPGATADVRELEKVLRARDIGGFDPITCLNDLTAQELRQAVHNFLADSERDEQCLIYISSHGVREAATSEFQFVARDTVPHDLARTAVPASFLNDRLTLCRARERVVILDCCYSGGFAVGLRTKGEQPSAPGPDQPRDVRPLETNGVVVISSSQASAASYTGTDENGPSLFTEHLVQALATGAADQDRDDQVSAMELFSHLNSRLRAQDRDRWQAPVISAASVDGHIYVARTPLNRSRRVGPSRPSDPRGTAATPRRAKVGDEPTFKDLIGYYRDCVRGESEVDDGQLVFSQGATHYACMSGAEQILSAADDETDGLLDIPSELKELAIGANADDCEFVYGYPVVVLHSDRDGKPQRAPRFAPLLLRRVELRTGNGILQMRPYGEVEVNPEFAKIWVGEEEAEVLRSTYRLGWTAGDRFTMARDIRVLLRNTFELECVQPLHPESLEAVIETDMALSGARNSAVMLAVKTQNRANTKLLEDLDQIIGMAGNPAKLRNTALAALFGFAEPLSEPNANEVMFSPLNPAQRDVLAGAMSQRVTVATGPPGTGKTALVVSVVATAAAAGQNVLVASSNNRAVDEVWERCNGSVPGLVVRTGSQSGEHDNRERERLGLTRLLASGTPPMNQATWSAKHRGALREHRGVLGRLDKQARAERELLNAGRNRQEAVERLPPAAKAAAATVASAELASLATLEARCRRACRAKIFGNARRARLLRSFGTETFSDPGEAKRVCAAILELIGAESRWRRMRGTTLEDDAALTSALSQAEQRVVRTGVGLVDAAVRENAAAGRSQLQGLLEVMTTRGTSDWGARKAAVGIVRAWAVTCFSTRTCFVPDPGLFDLVVIDEASQCSVAAVIPLLMRARRALIIGDPLQLPPVVKISPTTEADSREQNNVGSQWLVSQHAGHRDFSAFTALEHAASGSILMHEHYRCHPQIAAISNELFYRPRNKPLTILTRTSGLQRPDDERAVRWVDVPGRANPGRHGSSWVNEQEASRVHDAVEWLLRTLPGEATIGVVTPFAQQMERIARDWASAPRVRVGTAHRFQGGECDAIVFSLVAAPGMSRSGLAFLDRNPNLWNVAITRARAHLIVIGHRGYWTNIGGLGRRLVELAAPAPDEPSSTDDLVPGIPDDVVLERLESKTGGEAHRAVPSAGYVADVMLVRGERRTAFLIDRAPAESEPGDRHLRLQLVRTSLLASPQDGIRAQRLPAWRLFDEDWHPDNR
ncbi:RecA/RadA recombinase [Catenulispora sp. EB89]|uniref:caspase, EACC1-associated type n=1 Tax=Catenulispora sp. EB89 TaxID=3156257 RepID=UPI0035173301